MQALVEPRLGAGAMTFDLERFEEPLEVAASGAAIAALEAARRLRFPSSYRAGYRMRGVSRLSRSLGRTSMRGDPMWEQVGGANGFDDALGFVVQGSRALLVAGTLLRGDEVEPISPRCAELIVGHLAAAFPQREALLGPDDADIVLDAAGRTVHRTERGAHARELVEAAAQVLQSERSHGEPTDDALRVWRELLDGHWSLVEHEERDGKRFLLLRKEPRRHPRALTRSEREALSHLASGLDGKRLAAEMNITQSTASEHLLNGLRKLGFRDQIDFLRACPDDFVLVAGCQPEPSELQARRNVELAVE